MPRQTDHPLLPRTTHDELSLQNFIQSMRVCVTEDLARGNRQFYERALKPRLAGRAAPATRRDVQALLDRTPYYQAWSALQRTTQEMLWDAVGASIERQLGDLIDKARPPRGARGTLRLDPALPMPRYIEAVDIHVMPGNFQTELTADDVFAGALYDRGVYVFAMGNLGDGNDTMGKLMVAFLNQTFPDFRPRRILELGCSVGHSLLPYADGFPQAEVHGIDIGAPMLRYAHARAEALGRTVHFTQADACATDFPDGHFDLVVSHLLLHEMPVKEIRRMYRECHRLLAPGGIMAHFDGAPRLPDDPFDQCMQDWSTHYNNEPFSRGSKVTDFSRDAVAAGFHPDDVQVQGRKAIYLAEALMQNGIRFAVRR